GCRGCWAGRRVEPVDAEAGAREEAEQGPFAELGEHAAGFDLQQHGEFVAAPVSGGLAGDDGGDELATGGRLRRPGLGWGVAAGPAGAQRRRGADGDVDRGDGGNGAGPAVVTVEVSGGGAFDLAGAEAGPPGGQQGGKDSPTDDAGQVRRAVGADSPGGGEFLAGGLQ